METVGVGVPRVAARQLDALEGESTGAVGTTAFDAVERPSLDLAPHVNHPVLPLPTNAIAKLDGRLLGARAAYPAGTPIADIEPVDPPSGRSDERLFYVCGILTSPQRQLAELRELARHYNMSSIGVHHASRGASADLKRFLAAWRGENIDTLASFTTLVGLVNDALTANRPLMLVGHSQGALVIAAALRVGQLQAERLGLSAREVDTRLGRIRVVTFAAAADRFVDGPRYEHVVNRRDTVPFMFGPALTGHRGRDANVRFLEFDFADEQGVPDSAPGFYRAFNVTTHGLKGHLDALEGKAPPPHEPLGGG